MSPAFASSVLLWLTSAALPKDSDEKVRYLRQLPDKTATECVFTLQRGDKGSSIVSVTERGTARMTVSAHYDTTDTLTSAEATLTKGEQTMTARVQVAGGKAKVMRDKQDAQEFEVPKGVIVTSAPDWSDTFLLCQRYARPKGGKQEFVGLWIHPEQAAQRLTFTIERVGADAIEHNGKRLDLDRYAIRIRNNSEYVAWTDGKGRMIKLLSLPLKEGTGTELVLEGYDKSAAKLRPPQR
jgi:hypothetical protein